ncbi:MAG: DUF554 domain-containing protein [Treponema sp.]|jgi:uncharacterized membrane protein YqgA involved in biofilm formation|nr:DUF554 domain-containing protein [Treponema sp.]
MRGLRIEAGMLGPIVNSLAIVVCSLIGCFIVRGIPERFEEIIKKAAGLAVVYIGLKGTFESQRTLLLIMSLVIGAVIGECINIDSLMNRFGGWAEKKLGMSAGTFSKGFVSASILFCTGSMTFVGSIQSGLQGNHETLFAKSILDGSMSIVFGASMGIGALFSAFPVLVYEGGVALASMAISGLLTAEIITEMSAVGSLVITAIGFNFLGVKEIKVANLIPGMFIPWIWLGAMGM